MNKKAQTFSILEYYAIRIPVLFILVVIFIYVASSLEGRALSSHETRQQVILNRLFYSPNSISYFDELTGRVYPGIIDKRKFEDLTLDRAFDTRETKALTGMLQLKYLDTEEMVEVFINKEKYDTYRHYTKFEQYENFIDKRYVLVKDEDGLHEAVIKINFVIPNE